MIILKYILIIIAVICSIIIIGIAMEKYPFEKKVRIDRIEILDLGEIDQIACYTTFNHTRDIRFNDFFLGYKTAEHYHIGDSVDVVYNYNEETDKFLVCEKDHKKVIIIFWSFIIISLLLVGLIIPNK